MENIIITSGGRKYLNLDRDFLYSEYVIKRQTTLQIARQLKCDYRTITKKLKKFNIPVRDSGDYNTKNLIGQKFGWLTVIEKDKNKHQDQRAYWKCLCERCGEYTIQQGKNLCQGHAKSCGCPKKYSFEQLVYPFWKDAKDRAKLKNKLFNISIDYICQLLIKQEYKCAISGEILKLPSGIRTRDGTISLDRINSQEGYIENNIQWVHKDVNYIKVDFEEKEFFDWIKKIYEYKKLNSLSFS